MIEVPKLALSVRQPWAYAILHLGKPVENRGWRRPNPGLNFRGRVALHASAGMTRDEYESAAEFMASIGNTVPPAAELARGGIVGSVEIVDVVRAYDSPWFFGPVGLVLRDPRPCPFMPAKGSLGFFQWREGAWSDVPTPARWMLPPPPKAAPEPPADLFGTGGAA